MKLQPIQAHNQFIGYIGETQAVRHLQNKRHTILRRNYRNRFGEIDIISFNADKTLCFHEVKTIVVKKRFRREDRGQEGSSLRPSEDYRAEDNLSRKKIGCMMRATEKYLASFPVEDPYWEAHALIVHLAEDLECISTEMIPHINIEIS
jgi:hypothetical protein